MKALGAWLAIVTAVLVASPSGATAARTKSLRALPKASVLTLAGKGFAPRERVTLTVVADRAYHARVRATARGTFAVPFPRAPRCTVWHATTKGARSGRARFSSGPVDCTKSVDQAVPAGPAPAVGTGVAGIVMRGPTRPVCVVELPCDEPASGVEVEISNAGGVVARTMTGSDGRFSVYVAPGSYTVSAVTGRRSTPASVDVHAGDFSEVTISIDTGIR